ncbi:MAG: 3-dehydroquinate synthase [Bacteroidota bacterium]
MQEYFRNNTSHWSDVLNTGIEFGSIAELMDKLRNRDVFIITDCRVFAHYEHVLDNYPHWCLPEGENAKTEEVLFQVYEALLLKNIDRHILILGIGGGVVTDVTGYVASTYLRGVDFILVPTSLLAMVDAAIGGKNGINYKGYKNVIGCINQPEMTWIDPEFLHTLPNEHYYNGLAEVVKTAFVLDAELLSDIENAVDSIHKHDKAVLSNLLRKATRAKLKVVEGDEFDKGSRHVLNFGHTFGHALEMHHNMLHGMAVSKGMVAALRMSLFKGHLSETDYTRCIEVMKALRLPHNFEMHEALIHYIEKDKKCRAGKLDFVFLKAPGKAVVEAVDFDVFKKLITNQQF